MQIIPVIDLKDGHAVHAKRGLRDQYQPLKTPLCSSSEPCAVVEAFLTLHSFDAFYIADLNAITGNGNHKKQLSTLLSQYPQITFWIDAGYRRGFFTDAYTTNHIPVLGSECLHYKNLYDLIKHLDKQFILSLDFSMTEKLGPYELFFNPDFWPENVIIMPLDSVGNHNGPDLKKLKEYQQLGQNKNIIATLFRLEDLVLCS